MAFLVWPGAGVGVDSDQGLRQQRMKPGGGAEAPSFIRQMFLESPRTQRIRSQAHYLPMWPAVRQTTEEAKPMGGGRAVMGDAWGTVWLRGGASPSVWQFRDGFLEKVVSRMN